VVEEYVMIERALSTGGVGILDIPQGVGPA
jgi:hypothetical protein